MHHLPKEIPYLISNYLYGTKGFRPVYYIKKSFKVITLPILTFHQQQDSLKKVTLKESKEILDTTLLLWINFWNMSSRYAYFQLNPNTSIPFNKNPKSTKFSFDLCKKKYEEYKKELKNNKQTKPDDFKDCQSFIIEK